MATPKSNLSIEHDIAHQKVLPHLVQVLKWPKELISPYGRVPVESGTQTVWADFVCYIFKDQSFKPWLLVEVKKDNVDLKMGAAAQAESYSLMLNCPFCCVTDGKEYRYFATGPSQGKLTQILEPPVPDSKYFERGLKDVAFSKDIGPLVESFISAHLKRKKIRRDTEGHERDSKGIRRLIFNRDIDSLTKVEFGEVLDKYIMGNYVKNKHDLLANDMNKIKSVMIFIKDFKKNDPLIGLDTLLENGGDYHLRGGGLFFYTQLLAAAHPDDYVALEKNVAEALNELGITSIFVQPNTANGYLFINDICKKLHKEKIAPALKKAGLKYGHWAVHNFLWHYNAYYHDTKSSWTEKK